MLLALSTPIYDSATQVGDTANAAVHVCNPTSRGVLDTLCFARTDHVPQASGMRWLGHWQHARSDPRHCLLQSVRFNVSVLPSEESALKMRDGVVNGLVHDAAAGMGTPLVTAITPGAALTNAALFIDSNKAALRPAASAERGWCAAWFAARMHA